MNKNLSVTGILEESWKVLAANTSFIYYLFLPMFALAFIGTMASIGVLSVEGESSAEVVAALPGMLLWLLSGIVGVFSTISIMFFIRSGKKDSWKDWKQYFRLLLKFIGVSILYGLMIVAGLIALVIPGIYLAVRYAFVAYRTLEHPTDSIKDLFAAEARATAGNRWTIFLIGLVVIILSAIVGGILSSILTNVGGSLGTNLADFFVQLILTPFSTIVSILTYCKLTDTKEPEAKEKNEIEEKTVVEEKTAEPSEPLIPPVPAADPLT